MAVDELAKDVSSAEALIERHSEHKGELESRDDSLSKTVRSGSELLQEGTGEKANLLLFSAQFMACSVD